MKAIRLVAAAAASIAMAATVAAPALAEPEPPPPPAPPAPASTIDEDGTYKVSNVPVGEVTIGVNTAAAQGEFIQAQMQAGAMKGGTGGAERDTSEGVPDPSAAEPQAGVTSSPASFVSGGGSRRGAATSGAATSGAATSGAATGGPATGRPATGVLVRGEGTGGGGGGAGAT